MSLPGTTVTAITTAPPRQAPTDTSVAFVVGFTSSGPATAEPVGSLDDFVSQFGDRVAYSYLYDWIETYFEEGGSLAYVGRVFGPTPVAATVNLSDGQGSPQTSLVVTANEKGDWANGLKINVVGSGPYTIVIEDASSNVLETSSSLTTQADAVAWSATSAYVTITLGASTHIPQAETSSSLSGGTDDHGNAVDADWITALALFPKSLGPGQVCTPGHTSANGHAELIAHAAANNRVALLDFADTASRSTLVTAATTDSGVANSDHAAGFAPWALIPGLSTGTTRTVPYSAVAAGIMARNDIAGVSPNEPAAGVELGQSRYAVGLSQVPWSDTAGGDRELLNDAGVNVALLKSGIVTTYGYRTLADGGDELLLLSNARLVMAIVAQAQLIGENYVFAQIDGRGFLFADFAGDLTGMLTPFYSEGSLYGATPPDAFSVDVGSSVNTPDTIAAGELHAVISLRLSPFAEKVPIEVVSTPITGSLN